MFNIIQTWLQKHSLSTERYGDELRFKHSDTRSSILVMGDKLPNRIAEPRSPILSAFYSQCAGASIGNGHIIIGALVRDGLNLSHGYRLPDVNEMRQTAARLDMQDPVGAEVFMMEASWLFIYGMVPNSDQMVRFDREFDTYETVSGIESVLNDWWQIVVADDETCWPKKATSDKQ